MDYIYSIYRDCNNDSKVFRFIQCGEPHLTFTIQLLLMKFSLVTHQNYRWFTFKLCGSILSIYYLLIIDSIIFSMAVLQ